MAEGEQGRTLLSLVIGKLQWRLCQTFQRIGQQGVLDNSIKCCLKSEECREGKGELENELAVGKESSHDNTSGGLIN